MSAPLPVEPFVVDKAVLSFPTFCLFTTIWDDPKDPEAGRFPEDMIIDSAFELRVIFLRNGYAYSKLRVVGTKAW